MDNFEPYRLYVFRTERTPYICQSKRAADILIIGSLIQTAIHTKTGVVSAFSFYWVVI